VIPDVDLLIVFHNSRRWIPDLLVTLRQISVPITAYFLDNASTDGTPGLLPMRCNLFHFERLS